MLPQKAISNYEEYLKSDGRPDNTIRNYIATVNRFIKCTEINDVSEITSDSVVKFKNEELKRGIGGTSLNAGIFAIKSFLLYLYEAGHISENISSKQVCKSLKRDKAEARRGIRQKEDPYEIPGKSILPEHRRAMIRACTLMRESERNALMIEMGILCGLRISDLVELKLKNITIDKYNLGDSKIDFISQKTRNKVSFHIGSTPFMNKLIDYIKNENLEPDEYLFVTSRNESMTTIGFTKMFESVLELSGLSGEYTPHDMRRTCATDLLQTGILSLKQISMRLGHKSVTMTEKYLRLKESEEDKKNTRSAVSHAFT